MRNNTPRTRAIAAIIAALTCLALWVQPVAADTDGGNGQNGQTVDRQILNDGSERVTLSVNENFSLDRMAHLAAKARTSGSGNNPLECANLVYQNGLTFTFCGGGGGGGGGGARRPAKPPKPATPARPAAPSPPVAALECRTVPPANTALTAEAVFAAQHDTSTARYEYRVLWANADLTAALSPDVQADLDAAAAALAYAQLPSTQQAAADAKAAADAAQVAAADASEAAEDARLASEAVDAAWQAAMQHRQDASGENAVARIFADAALAAVAALRTQPVPVPVAPDPYTADATLGADLHELSIHAASQSVAHNRAIAEAQAILAQDEANDADGPSHPAAPAAITAADAADEAARQAQHSYDALEAHFVLLSQLRTDADDALRAAERASLAADLALQDAEAAADEAAAAADVDAAQQTVDTLTVANNPSVILLDDAPNVTSATGSSAVGYPLINDLDKLHSAVSVRESIRASASNAGGTSYSAWSDWSYWSDWSEWANDRGDRWTDANANGSYDSGEPFTDVNSNGHYDPPAGCPIRSVSTTPTNPNPCPHDPNLQAALYPAGHAEPYTDINGNGSWDTGEPYTDTNGDGTWTADLHGYRTGFCFPPTIGNPPRPHPCLQPGALCLGTGS